MAERGGRGGGGHRGNRGDRGSRGGYSGRGGGGQGGASSSNTERPKKENILDLSKYMDKRLTVKFSGGREIAGVLKGYDQLTNLVLDDCKEFMIAEDSTHYVRTLGLLVARGTLLVSIAPVDGSEQIENPFLAAASSDDSE